MARRNQVRKASSIEQAVVLIDRFVESFARTDDLRLSDSNQAQAEGLIFKVPDEYGFRSWRPTRFHTNEVTLQAFYANLPHRFPPLFELLLCSYRWLEVDVGVCTLLANPPGSNLSGFFSEFSRDRYIWPFLLKHSYFQFAKAPGGGYDPVCFDFRARAKSGDCPIVQIDHEEILCNERLRISKRLFDSFEALIRAALKA